ncbi:MAG: single-stranded DNA-binding protein [Candidatus Izemoplasmatales bacterium]|jgi:single-strand DNA-binding protein|nr:single-stranded DNA-binding protein [Candidatus Izemoplasmatales bacterium]MDD4354966.1 single-stranded DNA-binding protein [Candidatus Izemoplasmatales bacterium]MDD4988652.1 single-stranded DNA-binding protein [Candidatus Izemoplasmatales bacterium]NLF48089.1 single-stranded DNA-binding protein [Acholeplasmataceae bacterium]
MLNKVVLIGRLVRDPELRYTNNNIPVVSFTLAVNRPFVSQSQGQGDNNADFISCTVWRKQAENVSKYVNKGSMVAVEGRLQSRDYMDEKNNVRRYVTEVICDSVVFLDSKPQTETTNAPSQEKDKKEDVANHIDIIEDDLPF